jgi:heme-degrading monooxygenase HmoA
MPRVISIHEYVLKPGVSGEVFEQATHDAERRGLFDLPGLVGHHFLRGLKGARRGAYTVLWIFESRDAWERLWGTVDAPVRASDYPAPWKIWENEVLVPLLDQDPDAIRFTSYEEV